MFFHTKQDRIYQKIENLYKTHNDPWRMLGSAYEKDRLIKLLTLVKSVPHKKVLEIGCAKGDFTKALTQIADVVVAIDVAGKAVGLTKKKAPKASVQVATFANYKAGGQKFDVIVCAETLYYINDKDQALRKMRTLGHYLLTSHFLLYVPGIIAENRLRRENSITLVKRTWCSSLKEGKVSVVALWDLQPKTRS